MAGPVDAQCAVCRSPSNVGNQVIIWFVVVECKFVFIISNFRTAVLRYLRETLPRRLCRIG